MNNSIVDNLSVDNLSVDNFIGGLEDALLTQEEQDRRDIFLTMSESTTQHETGLLSDNSLKIYDDSYYDRVY